MTRGDVEAHIPLRGFHTESTCAVEGCERKPQAKDYCPSHYKRLVTHGNPLGARVYVESGPCHIDGCKGVNSAHGLCDTHLARYYRHGDPYFAPEQEAKPRTGVCEIDGCARPVMNLGMCTRHVYAHYKYGNPLVSRRRRRFKDEIETICRLDGCELPHKSVGYCNKHYVSVVREGFKKSGRAYDIRETFMRRLYESSCTWCGAQSDIHADHVMPLARGGEHKEGNLQPLCADCNRRKNDRFMIEWKWAMNRDALLETGTDMRHLPAPPGRAPRRKTRGIKKRNWVHLRLKYCRP